MRRTEEVDGHVPLSSIVHRSVVEVRNQPRVGVLVQRVKHIPGRQYRPLAQPLANSLEVVVCLFELVVEEQVALAELELAEVQLLDHIVPQYIRYS